MYKKRGQVTIFIIVGIILMFSVALFLYFRNISLPHEETEAVPAAYAPVHNYVRTCVDALSQRAITLIGIQGGYLELPPKIADNPDSYLPIIPNSDVRLPYWYYQGEARAPSLQDMQRDIGNYVSKNLLGCLQNFTPLLQRFSITPLGDITSLATIGEDDVTVQTTYPLSISPLGGGAAGGGAEGGENLTLSRFMARVPVRLKRMHDLALEILRAENQGLFLENATIDLMALGPGGPPDGIPFSDMEFRCGTLKWSKARVEQNVKERLFYNLPRITFSGTEFDPPQDLYAANNLNLKMVGADEDAYAGLRAGVYYSPSWDFLMNVRPSRGDAMSADFGKGNEKYLSYLCVNIYHFTYDIEYPVQVMLRDEAAFDGTGYDFSFATPVMIKQNEGNRANIGFNIFETPEGNDQGYCDQVADTETIIYAKDAATFEDLKDINLSFTCVGAFACPLGKTQSDGQVYRLRAKLPSFCTPGALEAEGAGYITTEQDVANVQTMTIMLTPKHPFTFTIMKRELAGETETFGAPKPLDEDEEVFLSLTTDAFPDFVQYKKLPLDEKSAAEDSGAEDSGDRIELADGDVTYHLDLLVVDKDNNLLGGYRGNWTPTLLEMDGHSRVTLYVMEERPPAESDEAQAQLFLQLEDPKLQEQLTPAFN